VTGMAAGGLDRKTWIVSSVVILGLIMSILDTTIVNVALNTLSHDLHASLAMIQWVSTGYLLSLALVIPLAGWMSERFGSKEVWMTSVALFALGSALCAAAPSAGLLIFFRIVQGLGGGMIQPVSMTVLAQAAGPARVGRVFSVIGVAILLGPILGPVIGGLIVDSASWRWIFIVNLPVAAVALALGRSLLPSAAGRADPGRLDWLGALLLSPGLAGIVFGLAEVEQHGGIGAPIAFGPMLAGAVLVVLFVLHAVRAPRPLIDVSLFRSRQFGAAAAMTFVLGGALFGTLLLLPLYYQVDRGYSALQAGLLMAPQGVGAALMLPISGRLVDRGYAGRVVVLGTVVMTLGTLPFAFVSSGPSDALLVGALVVRGLGLGASMLPAMASAFAALDRSQVPRATSGLNALQRVGGSIGTAFIAVVPQHQLRSTSPATAFGHTFVWAIALLAVAIVPAVVLALTQRSSRSHPRAVQAAARSAAA
jgi:EmrB/QacA subfamily drug resistance transporter